MLERMWSKGNTAPLLVGVQTCIVSLKNTRVFKLGISLPQDPAILLLGIYPKVAQSYHKDTCSAMFIAALLIIATTWKQLRCLSTEDWIEKIWFFYTMEHYNAVKIQ